METMKLYGPVVLIDDDQDDRDLMSEVLNQLGVLEQVRMFENGKSALEYLKTSEEKPFLIICDINMPFMNGLELRQHIHDNAVLKRKSIPFVFLSTSALEEHVEKAYDFSANGYFVKPISFSETREVFKSLFSYWKICKTPDLLTA